MKFGEHEITISKMEKADAAAVAALDRLCFACPWSASSFEYEAEGNPLARYLVAKDEGGNIIGYAGIWNIMDEGHITNVAVKPEFRGLGIAGEIIAELMALSSSEGVVRFTLEVRVSNETAQRVYKKFGFREAGYRRHFYEDNGEDAIIMWKE